MAYKFVPVMDEFRFALELKGSKEIERRTCGLYLGHSHERRAV